MYNHDVSKDTMAELRPQLGKEIFDVAFLLHVVCIKLHALHNFFGFRRLYINMDKYYTFYYSEIGRTSGKGWPYAEIFSTGRTYVHLSKTLHVMKFCTSVFAASTDRDLVIRRSCCR